VTAQPITCGPQLDYHFWIPEGPLTTTTIGRYRILEKVGQGGMGVVYRAHDTLLERVVALKVISTSIEDNPELRERFFREARAAGQLSHRNIITIHDLGEHDGQPYLAMEFLTGEDLQHRLARQEPMSLRRKLEVAAEICDGLCYAHRRGLIHRDVKPANIFITDEGVVKLLDFGLARMVASELTRSNMMMGTLNYMAPEQVRGERTDHRADIFSFGVVLYEMLSGRKAFQGDSFATTLYKILQDVPEPLLNIDSTLPPDLVWLVEKTLAKARDERYQDLTDVVRDLAIIRQHLSESDAVTMPATPAPHRAPADSPSPRLRRTPSDAGSTQDRVESDRPRAPRSGSGSRPRSTPSGTGLASESDRAEQPAEVPASRRPRTALFVAGGLAIVVLGAVGAWSVLKPSPPPESSPPSTTTASVPVEEPRALPPPPAPQTPAADDRPAAPAADASVESQRRAANEARSRMLRAKTAARQAGSAAMSSRSYAAAAAAEREGERLYRGRQHPEATAKFYEASGLYHSAELTPPPVTSARPQPSQPTSPRPEPERTEPSPQPPPEPAPAAPPKTSAPALPTTEKPVQLPSGAAPRIPPTPAPRQAEPPITAAEGASSPENAVRELVRRYQQAMEARSLDAIRRLWPGLSGVQEDALRREFQQARRIEIEVDDPRITLTGATGTVVFIRRYHITTVDGQRLDRNSRTTMSVRRAGTDWLIDRVNFEAIR
jgi:serine/threonine-protein kinase